MRVRNIGQSILNHLFTGYLKLLKKTVSIQWAVHNYGEVNKKYIPELPVRVNMSECDILVKEMS